MIEVVTEETHGSDRVPDLNPITRRALVGSKSNSKQQKLPRERNGALRSARTGAPQKCLTLPTLLETGCYDNLRGDRPIPRARAAIKVTIGVTTSVMIPKGINVIAAVMKATPARIAQSFQVTRPRKMP